MSTTPDSDTGAAAPPPMPGPPAAAPGPAIIPTQARGRLVLSYTPDGPVGGTFTCMACAAQAWQPDLLDHTPACPHRPVAQAARPERR